MRLTRVSLGLLQVGVGLPAAREALRSGGRGARRIGRFVVCLCVTQGFFVFGFGGSSRFGGSVSRYHRCAKCNAKDGEQPDEQIVTRSHFFVSFRQCCKARNVPHTQLHFLLLSARTKHKFPLWSSRNCLASTALSGALPHQKMLLRGSCRSVGVP